MKPRLSWGHSRDGGTMHCGEDYRPGPTRSGDPGVSWSKTPSSSALSRMSGSRTFHAGDQLYPGVRELVGDGLPHGGAKRLEGRSLGRQEQYLRSRLAAHGRQARHERQLVRVDRPCRAARNDEGHALDGAALQAPEQVREERGALRSACPRPGRSLAAAGSGAHGYNEGALVGKEVPVVGEDSVAGSRPPG